MPQCCHSAADHKGCTVAAIERLARADRQHAMTIDEWDAHLWLLNTPSGIVNLKSGEVSAHRPDAYCTKITSVGLSNQQPRLWLAFLNRITDGNSDLQAFLRRIFGYSVTGDTTEHALFFQHGTGKNGKTVYNS